MTQANEADGRQRLARYMIRCPFALEKMRYDDNGVGVSTGLRSRVDSKFEFRGLVNHINMDNSQDTHVELAGDYYVTPTIAVGASVKFAGDADSFTIGARWFFE